MYSLGELSRRTKEEIEHALATASKYSDPSKDRTLVINLAAIYSKEGL
jgi:hypothetical protein